MKKAYAMKLSLSILLVLTGAALGITFAGEDSQSTTDTVTLDFGDYNIRSAQVSKDANAAEALNDICSDLGYAVTYGENDQVKTVNGQPGVGDARTWNLYTMGSDHTWHKYSGKPSSVKISSEIGVAWGLCAEGEFPTTTVDSTGQNFYGFGTAKRIVCLAPSCTETVCELGGEDLIVGTDRYSNYPASVEQKRNVGIIAEIGSYTSPSYEAILKVDPDLVIGIASQYNHKAVCNKLREVGINAIVVGDGEDLKTVYDNTYMTGIAMGLTGLASQVTLQLKEQVEQTHAIIEATSDRPTVMTALSADKSPWVAGINTYISDIYSKSGALNAFGTDVDGWRQINSETIVQNNPSIIIVISEETATASSYAAMLSNLSEEWKSTDAYKDGKIYMISDSAADLLSRPSTRLAQLTELLGRMFHQDAFPEVIEVPMYFGDNYTDFITYSKTL